MTGKITIDRLDVLLAHAQVLETEAMERYQDLAEQMEVHHNHDVAKLFRKMAHVESIHVQKIIERAGDITLPQIHPWDYQWPDEEAPEVISDDDIHYLMTPHHALMLALKAEQRALDFFTHVVENLSDGPVRDMAEQLRVEETEHVALIKDWLARVDEPGEDWDEDPDPPVLQE